ncbi:LuxR C-terminal-related transcriptional regulator [Kitasatospora sp. NPDC059571]|uniref:LuxR C-terminal-related transcriptional regulator n=1 Tax=Kitasatospora sp. NPDC059571 TaxID=3346871 RepID=UPI00367473EF
MPPVPDTFVDRPRLADLLTRGTRHPLVLVNGPAGAGKTLLVARWITGSNLRGPTAWLTAEHEDNAPGVFWAYLLEALRRGGVALPDDIAGPVRPDRVDRAMLTRLAAHLGTLDEPVVVVLDEFERITEPAVAEELDCLLRHAADGLRLVLISRNEPLLPLHRYRAAGAVAEIRASEMAFTADETDLLLRRHGLSVSDEGVRALTDRTEGWAAGLRLCALAAGHTDDPETYLKEFEAGDNTVADFLLAEVLDSQPPQTQDLLLRVSILDRVHPDLGDALTGRRDAAAILDGLRRANAFVTPLGHSWYRLHPLFAEILSLHLRARLPGAAEELHRAAACWLHGHGRVADALPHAAAAHEWGLASSWFVDDLGIGRLFHGLESDRWADLFADLPPDARGAAADLVRAARRVRDGDPDGALRFLDRAEAAAGDGSQGAARRLSAAVLRVLAAAAANRVDLAEQAERTAEQLEGLCPPDLLRQRPELAALRLAALGAALLWAGRSEDARAALAAALRAAEGRALAPVRHEVLGRLALIELSRGAPGRAEVHARQAAAEAERSGLPPAAQSGLGPLVLAETAVERGDVAAARAGLARAEAAARPDPVFAVGPAVVRSRLALGRGGDPRAALRILARARAASGPDGPSPWAEDRLALAESVAHLAARDPGAALAALAAGDGPARSIAVAQAELAGGDARSALDTLAGLPHLLPQSPLFAVGALLVRAEAAQAVGDPVAARRAVAAALAAARSDRLRRPFVEAGPWLRRLLRERPELSAGHAWLTGGPPAGGSSAAAPSAAEPAGPLVVEALSVREHDVLERVAELMSTEEVAADLHVSVNTVKTHLKNINRKLGATRRGEAVRRARELHLL